MEIKNIFEITFEVFDEEDGSDSTTCEEKIIAYTLGEAVGAFEDMMETDELDYTEKYFEITSVNKRGTVIIS